MEQKFKINNQLVPGTMLQDFFIQTKAYIAYAKEGKTLTAYADRKLVVNRPSLRVWSEVKHDHLEIFWEKQGVFDNDRLYGFRSTTRHAADDSPAESYGEPIVTDRTRSGSHDDYIEPDTTYYYTFFIGVSFDEREHALRTKNLAKIALTHLMSYSTADYRYGFSAFQGRVTSSPMSNDKLASMLETSQTIHALQEWMAKLTDEDKDRYSQVKETKDRLNEYRDAKADIARERARDLRAITEDDTLSMDDKDRLSLEVDAHYEDVEREIRRIFTNQ